MMKIIAVVVVLGACGGGGDGSPDAGLARNTTLGRWIFVVLPDACSPDSVHVNFQVDRYTIAVDEVTWSYPAAIRIGQEYKTIVGAGAERRESDFERVALTTYEAHYVFDLQPAAGVYPDAGPGQSVRTVLFEYEDRVSLCSDHGLVNAQFEPLP